MSDQTQAPAPQTPAADADALLVQRAVQGDQHAYELLVIKYQRRIERLIARMVRDADAVEDIAQETFIRAWRALPKFRGEAQFYTWLYRIAVNTAKKALMERKRDPLVSEHAFRAADDENETPAVVFEKLEPPLPPKGRYTPQPLPPPPPP